LADEVLQDTSGARSFFYVGDVKQAIYGWRGGNARLFGKILDQYRDQIHVRPLNVSFRSCQPIIDTVNRAFGSLPGEMIPQATIAEWKKVWQTHECRKAVVPDRGYAAMLEPKSDEAKPTEEDRHRLAASLVKEIDPLNRGLSVAVLVRSNESGKRAVNALRRECPGITVVHEGRAAIEDNPVVSLLLSLAKLAAHPGDTLAWRHLNMSPLRDLFEKEGLSRDSLPLVLLREIQNAGFSAFIRDWGRKLDTVHPLDDFGHQRLRNLIDAAGEYDAAGSRDVNAFLHFVDNYMIHDPGSEDAVRVMTIHQSKGLGFDVVILPDLQGRSMTDLGNSNLFVARDFVTNVPLWAMTLPRKLIAGADPTLASHLRDAEAEACFDSLSLLYVALTRARQGLYIITSFAGKHSKIVDSAAFLKAQIAHEGAPVTIAGEEFSCLYEAGERDWYIHAAPRERPPSPEAGELAVGFAKQPSRRTRLMRVAPSEEVEGERRADELFADSYYQSLKLGTALHGLFEKVAWIEQADIEALIGEWEKSTLTDDELKPKAIERFRQALGHEEIKAILSRPLNGIDLWRERRFEIVLEDKWVTGSFDRVVIERDTSGRAITATIIDFKTDEIGGADDPTRLADRYRPQLYLYRKALSRMTGLDPSKIGLKLVFTHAGKVVRL
ncbi:MAG: hypothetical protein FJZ95_01230, partial [Chloroflexi bacterium]|nr:hypothetical protein [Chloroflexota bacterium]